MELRRNKLVARIAARLAQFRQNVVQRVYADGKPTPVNLFQQLRLSNDLVDARIERLCDLLNNRVRLGMDCGHIQRIIAIPNAQKTRRLLKGLRANTRHFQHLRCGTESSHCSFAIAHNIQCGSFRDSRHMPQQRPR